MIPELLEATLPERMPFIPKPKLPCTRLNCCDPFCSFDHGDDE